MSIGGLHHTRLTLTSHVTPKRICLFMPFFKPFTNFSIAFG
jgi:hypothetical protein